MTDEDIKFANEAFELLKKMFENAKKDDSIHINRFFVRNVPNLCTFHLINKYMALEFGKNFYSEKAPENFPATIDTYYVSDNGLGTYSSNLDELVYRMGLVDRRLVTCSRDLSFKASIEEICAAAKEKKGLLETLSVTIVALTLEELFQFKHILTKKLDERVVAFGKDPETVPNFFFCFIMNKKLFGKKSTEN